LKHRQEGGGVLRQGEGGIGDDARGIVDEGDQIALALGTLPDHDARPVRHIAHPQLPRLVEREAAPVGHGICAPGLGQQGLEATGAAGLYPATLPV
jgi:hypothetical protein